MLKNEQGQTRREGAAKLRNLERTYILNVPLLDIVIVKGTQRNKPEQIMTNITQNEAQRILTQLLMKMTQNPS